MRSITGLILLLVGFGVGAHAYFPDTFDKHVHLTQMARVESPAGVGQRAYSVTPAIERTFSPGRAIASDEQTHRTGSIKTVVEPEHPILTTAPKVVSRDGWKSRVVRVRASGDAVASKVGTPTNYYGMVRAVQTELKRVGCYDGRIDGSWGAGSKYAIREFLQLVNSALPSDKPDHFMLALLRSYKGVGCDAQCGSGFTKSSHGRCLPYAITAQAETNSATEPDLRAPVPVARLVRRDGVMPQNANIVRKTRRAPPPGMMAIGGPAPDRYSARQIAPGVSSAPQLTSTAPQPVVRVKPVHRPTANKRTRSSKTRRATKSKARRYRSASRKRARRRALIRQAFGEDFQEKSAES